MQVTQTVPQSEANSGFRTIPTRIQDTPPLVVEREASVTEEVVRRLEVVAEGLARSHRTSAEAYLTQGMYDQALPHLDAAVTFAANNIEYRNQLGFVRYLTGDDQGAIEAFEIVLAADPSNADASFNMGMVQFGQGQFVTAEKAFARALESMPKDAETWNNRGVCLFQLGRVDDAKTCFEQTLAIEPDNADAQFNLQNC